MSVENESKNITTWVRWIVGIAILLAAYLHTASTFAGESKNRLEQAEKRLEKLEVQQITPDRMKALEENVKEIRDDVKKLRDRSK